MTADAGPLGTRIDRASQTPGTWAGGTTRAIYASPAEAAVAPAGAHVWVGTAVIQRAAAYSFFPGRVRLHMPIHGSGIRLHFRDPAEGVALATFAQHRFDGARPVAVELIDGPITAFNLIVQTDVVASAQVLRVGPAEVGLDLAGPAQAQMAGDTSVLCVVYAVAGSIAIRVAGQPAIELHPDDAFVFHPRAAPDDVGQRVGLQSLAADATIVIATVEFRPDA